MNSLYVIVTERDLTENTDFNNPIIWETSIKVASLENAKSRIESLGGAYGEAKIYKLVEVESSEQCQ